MKKLKIVLTKYSMVKNALFWIKFLPGDAIPPYPTLATALHTQSLQSKQNYESNYEKVVAEFLQYRNETHRDLTRQ